MRWLRVLAQLCQALLRAEVRSFDLSGALVCVAASLLEDGRLGDLRVVRLLPLRLRCSGGRALPASKYDANGYG